mgnify:CR=1 FL=1
MLLKNNKYKNIIDFLSNSNIRYLENESMKKHTTFGIGGPVDILIFPKTIQDILFIIDIINKDSIPLYFIGSGSNLLIDDNGVRGIIISLKKSFKEVVFEEDRVYVQSGVMLGNLVKQIISKNISGYESLIGVPGTLGGALIMNAGAYGYEISNNLISARTISLNGKINKYKFCDIDFKYRSSSFKDTEILIDAYFKCEYGNKNDIYKNKMECSQSRKRNQPLKFRSAGSIFKNPNNNKAAGYLIDQAGLKGEKCGDAEISKKHANFIINHGNANSDDVMNLITMIQKEIKTKYDIKLDLEIKLIGVNNFA